MHLTRSEKRAALRKHLWSIMHDGKGRAGHAFNFSLVIVILLSVAILPLELLPGYQRFSDILHIVEAVIVALFTVEYFLRVYSAPKRLRYVFSFFGIVDLLSIIPFYSGIFGTEYIRALRLVRFLKLGEIEAAAAEDEVQVMQTGIGLVEGEQVEYVVTKHPLFLILGCLPPIVAVTFALGLLFIGTGPVALGAALSLFLFALIFLVKAWLDFGYDVIYLTNYRLIFHNQHLLGRSINQVSYPSITNVKPFYPSIFSYVFRYGSLVIDTAAEHPGQISLHMVRSHEKAAHRIMQKCFVMRAAASQSMPG